MILAVDNLRPWRKYMNEDHHHFIEQQHKIFFQAQWKLSKPKREEIKQLIKIHLR